MCNSEFKISICTALLLLLIMSVSCFNGERMVKLYFISPEEAVDTISQLLANEDFLTLTGYYELRESNISIEDFYSGKYYRGEIAGEKPAGLFKYVKPFSPGFKFSYVEELENKITRVHLTLEIEQGEGMVLRSIHSFDLVESEKGFRILP